MDKDKIAKILKIKEKESRALEIEGEMASPSFWSDREGAAKLSQELSTLYSLIKEFEGARSEEEVAKLEKRALFGGEHDVLPAILSVHAGAGGTEAQDWAEMLLTMYLKFAEKNDLRWELLSKSQGEEAGIKSAALKVGGLNAYGLLKGEAGVHRLVRISPYDADKARHTSFALVEVLPEFDRVDDVKINDKDLKIDVFRSSGHGGQSVNTTDSAVRITYLPTKTTVTVQNERSQLQNKTRALKILASKIKKSRLDKQKEREQSIKGGHTSAEWGNQIRSYVLQPYQQVKDHRTGHEESDPRQVLSGDLDGFIES